MALRIVGLHIGAAVFGVLMRQGRNVTSNFNRKNRCFRFGCSVSNGIVKRLREIRKICSLLFCSLKEDVDFARSSNLLKIPFVIGVTLGAGCSWSQGGADESESKSYEVAVSLIHQVHLEQVLLGFITTQYPSNAESFRFQPGGPVGRSVAKRLHELGYRISNITNAPALLYTLDSYEPHGLHLSVQAGDWRVARLYRVDSDGRLQELGISELRALEGSRNSVGSNHFPVATSLQSRPTTETSSGAAVKALGSTSSQDDVQSEPRWAVQVIAGQQLLELERLRAKLQASGYRVELVEKRWLGLYAVQIRGLNSRKEAEKVRQVQRAGEFEDAFLVQYNELRPIDDDHIAVAQVTRPINAKSERVAAGATKPKVYGADCDHVEIELGSLRENVRRLLDQCGYALGEWRVGPDGYVDDWLIQRRYEVVVRDGLTGVLGLLKHNYFLEGQVRPFTQTIDFQSAEGAL